MAGHSGEDDPEGPFGSRCFTLTLSQAIDRVITRQQDHLRHEAPHLFHEDGRPRSTRMVLFPPPPLPCRRIRRAAVRQRHNRLLAGDLARPVRRNRRTRQALRPGTGVPLRLFGTPMPNSAPTPASRSTSCESSWPTRTLHHTGLLPASHPRRVEAVRAIAANYQFDLTGGRIRTRNPTTTLPTGSAPASALCPSPRDAATK
ncbi:hypothetical protein E4U92_15725 [Streptomyces galbus]|uniref:Uncharacterized protein n=1 Tax=Streptomyces galbus TaxID=33898 RepID=A0A4U5X4P2_STRGB|nr:hypothetical protein E4U92_15725 [Streptomyces galbus]